MVFAVSKACCAYGVAVVGRGRRDMKLLEASGFQNATVVRGVQGTTTTQSEIFRKSAFIEIVEQFGHDFLEDGLTGAGEVRGQQRRSVVSSHPCTKFLQQPRRLSL